MPLPDEPTRDHPGRTILDIGSYLGVPLFDDSGHPLGCLCAPDPHPHSWSSIDRGLLVDLSAAVASEMRGRIAAAIAEQATGRIRALADASEVLNRTLDVDASLDAILDIVIPALASACAIYAPEVENESRRLLFRRVPERGGDLGTIPRHLNDILSSEPVGSVLVGQRPYYRVRTGSLAGSDRDGHPSSWWFR